MDNPATLMLGPAPCIRTRLILLTWVDPRDKPEDDGGETERPGDTFTGPLRIIPWEGFLTPSGGVLDVAAEEELADAGVLQ